MFSPGTLIAWWILLGASFIIALYCGNWPWAVIDALCILSVGCEWDRRKGRR